MASPRQRSPESSVILIEENPLAAQRLEQILTRGGITVFTESVNPSRPRKLLERPPVVLIDGGSLRERLGARLRALRLRFPDGKVLVVGRKQEAEELCRLLFLGVKGFVAYEDAEADLCRAVRTLSEGRMSVTRETLERFARDASQLGLLRQRGAKAFTEREDVILGLVERRMCDKEIADILAIKQRTVRFHLQNIFAKLGVHDRHAAVQFGRLGMFASAPAVAASAGGSAPRTEILG